MGYKLIYKEQIKHNKATSALGIWKQRIQDLSSFEEKVIMNLGLACKHLCPKYPKTSVRHLLNHFAKPENKW
jgi:hypothetical protein